jgi:hypothetical protein
LEIAEKARDGWSKEFLKLQSEQGAALGAKFELGKLKKIIKIISHITAGRGNEAIQELLQPIPVVISLDIRYDDKSRIAAENEQLERLKKIVVDVVSSAKINREEKHDAPRSEKPSSEANPGTGQEDPGKAQARDTAD